MITHTFPHTLDNQTAKITMDQAFDWYKQQYPDYQPQLVWQSPVQAAVSFAAKGLHIKGRLVLAPQSIQMELEVPLMLRMFKGLAVDKIQQEMKRWIAKAEAGQLPGSPTQTA